MCVLRHNKVSFIHSKRNIILSVYLKNFATFLPNFLEILPTFSTNQNCRGCACTSCSYSTDQQMQKWRILLHPLILWGVSRRAIALGGVEILHGFQRISADSTARRDQVRSEMKSLHLVLRWPLGRFPRDVASRSCLASLSWDILDTLPGKRYWELSIRRNGSTFRALWISQLRTLLHNDNPSTIRKNPISASCISEITLFQSLCPRFMTTGEDRNKDLL